MKKTLLASLSIFIFILAGCGYEINQQDPEREKDAPVKTDQEFCRRCERNGVNDAFVYYAAGDALSMREGKHPVIGRRQLKAVFSSSHKNKSSLRWEINKVDVSDSDERGYTFGNWKFTTMNVSGKDTTIYGNYVAVWKKQTDGSWKYVSDGGDTTPAPEKINL